MCGVNKAETRGYGCSRKVMRGGGGGGDRVGKKISKTGNRFARQALITDGVFGRYGPLGRRCGGDGSTYG